MCAGIRLSQKYGVNPAIPICFYCGEQKNELILAGQLPGDAEAPRNMAWDKRPCDKCEALMAQGIIFISVDEQKTTDRTNPYRTGGWCVVKEEAVRERMGIRPPELLTHILQRRVAFIPDDAWDLLGLPRGEWPPKTPAGQTEGAPTP